MDARFFDSPIENHENDTFTGSNPFFAHPKKPTNKTNLPASKSEKKNASTEPEYVNHAIKYGLRHLFDVFYLALAFKAQHVFKANIDLGKYNWTTYFAFAYLYFKFRNILNPIRDEAGIYRYLLEDSKHSAKLIRSTSDLRRLSHFKERREQENEMKNIQQKTIGLSQCTPRKQC